MNEYITAFYIGASISNGVELALISSAGLQGGLLVVEQL